MKTNVEKAQFINREIDYFNSHMRALKASPTMECDPLQIMAKIGDRKLIV